MDRISSTFKKFMQLLQQASVASSTLKRMTGTWQAPTTTAQLLLSCRLNNCRPPRHYALCTMLLLPQLASIHLPHPAWGALTPQLTVLCTTAFLQAWLRRVRQHSSVCMLQAGLNLLRTRAIVSTAAEVLLL